MNLLKWFWLYPSMAMTAWTVLTFVAAWTFRRNRAFPSVFGLHLMMMQLNPKDEILYERPSPLAGLAYLALGATPLAVLVWAVTAYVVVAANLERVQRYFRTRVKKQVST